MERELEKLSVDPFITSNFEHRWIVNQIKYFYKKLPPKLNDNDKKLMVYLHVLDIFEKKD